MFRELSTNVEAHSGNETRSETGFQNDPVFETAPFDHHAA